MQLSFISIINLQYHSTDHFIVFFILGVEFPDIPDTKGVPLVADMSSNMLSRPFDITKVSPKREYLHSF